MNFRSYDDLYGLVINNINKFDKDIDLIVGVPRSGMIVANMIAVTLNKPLTDFNGLFENRIFKSGSSKKARVNSIKSIEECKKILIVEDSVASGTSIDKCKSIVEQYAGGEQFKDKLIYMAAFVLPGVENKVDFYFEVLPSPRMFSWNIFQHAYMEQTCFDMDGVLCYDPTDKQNDDGEKYLEFIANVEPKIIPTIELGAIVTSRLEKYRKETEEWLKKHNVRYKKLIMLNATAEERVKNNMHATFKADYYKKSTCMLFVESCVVQAETINELTGKPVYCIENARMYDGSKNYNKKIQRKMNRSPIKKFLLKFKVVRCLNDKRKALKK